MPSSNPSGTVVQDGLAGGSALYTDTGSYNAPVTSRILTVYDYQGNVLQVFNMGSTLTQVYTFPADVWLQFTCVVIDNTGTWTANVYFVSQGYYWVTYQTVYNASACGCLGNNWNLVKSQLALVSALRANLAGPAGAAQANRDIIAANVYVNQALVIQLA